ncbi:hypothetical protein BCR33DRAFT_716177 [Rhizoclosmatium globosum]|uniref:Uncharacterized protein n=1 Tax=Rhizoclosmatium globosum TaxID=329046 RepID=A0A1Y2CEQ2_9FUNG|nr:hypothetical protein BCR33DRAFT_716177 [Rhizoclosmatium globosum]|eukprot:ORY45492.1 hypothetical protein BCR33DRAFT_716177 [Rhizoclosmatium globosum]
MDCPTWVANYQYSLAKTANRRTSCPVYLLVLTIIAYYDIIIGVCVVAFEAFVLWVYIRYLQKLILVLEALTALNGNYNGDTSAVQIFINLGQNLCPLLYTYIQLGMKWHFIRTNSIAKEVASGLRTPDAKSTVMNTSSSALSNGKPISRTNLDMRQGRPVSYSGLQPLRPVSLSRLQQKRPASLVGFEQYNNKY